AMRFSRIRLENWRNFGEVDVPVATRVFLVGANASGKSNFLDALRFLRDLVSTGGGFQKAIQDRGGVTTIRNLAARRETSVAVEVEISEDDCLCWRYRLVFGQENSRFPPVLRQERVWDSQNNLLLNRPDDADREDAARLGQTQLEQVFGNRNFREIVDFFQSIKYSHLVPQIVRDPEITAVVSDDPFGSDFLDMVATTHVQTRKARLRRIQKTLKAVAPGYSQIEFIRDELGNPHLRGKYEHWRKRGAWQIETEFSDGTLRLIGMPWALQDGEGPLLLEEPELSLHSEVVRLLPQMMYMLQRTLRKPLRQVVVSTHSPGLLEDEGIGAHEVLFLEPSGEGASVQGGFEFQDVLHMLDAGIPMSEIAMSRTRPRELQGLYLDF
ncbi:MAG: AAA family ATPase, partial [Anaerolineaceae bacterium]|nr:AAA family ATPase [Anaerolineaceae bacterium]